MAQKKPRIVLPAGIAVFPKLNEVDVYQPVDKKGKPSGAQKRRYITYIRYEDEAKLAKAKQMILDAAKASYSDIEDDIKLPVKKLKVKDKEGKVTGHEFVIQATSGEKHKPAVFDRKLNQVPEGVIIGGGSKLALDVTVNQYDGFGGGLNLYINAVQLLSLVEGGRVQHTFEEADEGDYEYSGDGEDKSSNFSAVDDEDEDDATKL